MNSHQSSLKRASLTPSSLNLSSLTLSSDDESSRSTTNSPTPTLSRGWGSAQSRAAYADLSSLLPAQPSMPRQQSSASFNTTEAMDVSDEPAWGYFVDTPDDEDGVCFWRLWQLVTLYIWLSQEGQRSSCIATTLCESTGISLCVYIAAPVFHLPIDLSPLSNYSIDHHFCQIPSLVSLYLIHIVQRFVDTAPNPFRLWKRR